MFYYLYDIIEHCEITNKSDNCLLFDIITHIMYLYTVVHHDVTLHY